MFKTYLCSLILVIGEKEQPQLSNIHTPHTSMVTTMQVRSLGIITCSSIFQRLPVTY